MCLMVIRAPSTNLAKSALSEVDKVCDLFEDAAAKSQIASNNLVDHSILFHIRLSSSV